MIASDDGNPGLVDQHLTVDTERTGQDHLNGREPVMLAKRLAVEERKTKVDRQLTLY
jgi:hypothetical protein